MQILQKVNPVLRAVGVIGAVAALVTGVTFAALSSSATLTGNTLATADANLLLWDGDSFESTAPGFDVTGLVPGEGSGENFFYFQNAGEGALHVTARVPVPPLEPAGGYDFTGWENLEVTIKSYEPGCGPDTVSTTMAALLSPEGVALPCNPLAEGATGDNTLGAEETEGNFSVEFDINPVGITGDDPGVGDFDIVFTGSLIAPTP